MGAAGARLKWQSQEIDASGVVRINKNIQVMLATAHTRLCLSLFVDSINRIE
jgi:hypothetical protein